jgi:hypothetical protein
MRLQQLRQMTHVIRRQMHHNHERQATLGRHIIEKYFQGSEPAG